MRFLCFPSIFYLSPQKKIHHLEDGRMGSQVLYIVSNLYLISHETALFGRGPTTPLRGLKRSPWWLTSWWFQPIWKMLVKMGIFPNFRGENQNIFELPPPSYPRIRHVRGMIMNTIQVPLTWKTSRRSFSWTFQSSWEGKVENHWSNMFLGITYPPTMTHLCFGHL